MTERFVTRGFVGRASRPGPAGDAASRIPPGQYLTTDFPVLSAGPTPRTPLDRWSFTIEGLVREPVTWTWDEFTGPAGPRLDGRHQLRHEVDQARHALARRQRRHAARGRRARPNGRVRDRLLRRRLHDEPADRRRPQRPGLRRLGVRRQAARAGARRARAARRPGAATSGRARSGSAASASQDRDEPGFWESLGYHNRGDQWLEERYSGD